MQPMVNGLRAVRSEPNAQSTPGPGSGGEWARLEIRALTVYYGPRRVLDDISLQVAGGQIMALIGPNGAGKTTLIRAVSGVLPLRSGTIELNGDNLAQFKPDQRARRLAVVPQARDLPGAFSVWETVLLGRTPYLGWLGRPSALDQRRVYWALEQTETLALADRPIGQLSGGEQQRVLLARALAQETPVLLLDEPTTHLDLRHQTALLDLIALLARQQGLAVLMALHDLNLAAIYADRVALLVEGRLRALGSGPEVLTPGLLSEAYHLPLHVITHPDYGTPLILPDGYRGQDKSNL